MPCNVEAIKSEFKAAVRGTATPTLLHIRYGLIGGGIDGNEIMTLLAGGYHASDATWAWVKAIEKGDHSGNSTYAELASRWIAEVMNETDEPAELVKTLVAKWNHLHEADTSVGDEREEFSTLDVINALLGKGE